MLKGKVSPSPANAEAVMIMNQAVQLQQQAYSAMSMSQENLHAESSAGIINISTGAQVPIRNQINIIAKKRPPNMPIKNFESAGIDPKRKVLYRNFHEVSQTIYLIEISRNALKVFFILFPNFEAPDIYISETLPEKVAQRLMTENSNMFEELIKKFSVKFGKL